MPDNKNQNNNQESSDSKLFLNDELVRTSYTREDLLLDLEKGKDYYSLLNDLKSSNENLYNKLSKEYTPYEEKPFYAFKDGESLLVFPSVIKNEDDKFVKLDPYSAYKKAVNDGDIAELSSSYSKYLSSDINPFSAGSDYYMFENKESPEIPDFSTIFDNEDLRANYRFNEKGYIDNLDDLNKILKLNVINEIPVNDDRYNISKIKVYNNSDDEGNYILKFYNKINGQEVFSQKKFNDGRKLQSINDPEIGRYNKSTSLLLENLQKIDLPNLDEFSDDNLDGIIYFDGEEYKKPVKATDLYDAEKIYFVPDNLYDVKIEDGKIKYYSDGEEVNNFSAPVQYILSDKGIYFSNDESMLKDYIKNFGGDIKVYLPYRFENKEEDNSQNKSTFDLSNDLTEEDYVGHDTILDTLDIIQDPIIDSVYNDTLIDINSDINPYEEYYDNIYNLRQDNITSNFINNFLNDINY